MTRCIGVLPILITVVSVVFSCARPSGGQPPSTPDDRATAPLRDPLTNVSHVILFPDDKLNLVPFAALINQQWHYEIERRLVTSGEGVYGMRRALVLAGAESQVVSLWNANDASTREMMRAFYGELSRSTGRAESLRRAKLQLLRQPRFAHPYYWAAFIPAGDWTPLTPDVLKRQEHNR